MEVIIVDDSKESRILKNNLELYISDKADFGIESLEIRDVLKLSFLPVNCAYVFHSLQRRKEIIRKANILRSKGVKKIYVAAIELMWADWDVLKEKPPFIPIEELDYMDTLLIPICEHCNLNCKGCSHFSPLVHQEKFLDWGGLLC